MAKVDLYEFGDILRHAKTLGYDWNTAHDILDPIYPYYGVMYVDEDDLNILNDDGKKILKSFMKSEKVEEFSFAPKGG